MPDSTSNQAPDLTRLLRVMGELQAIHSATTAPCRVATNQPLHMPIEDQHRFAAREALQHAIFQTNKALGALAALRAIDLPPSANLKGEGHEPKDNCHA